MERTAFSKEANSPKIVYWHQDLTYWGLDDTEEATCWVALSPATRASGCMKFVPSSHKKQLVPHVDTYDDNNMLSRGQEIAVEVNEEDAVAVELQPGQASLHHGHLFHASGPNTTDDRRIGAAIRYIKPSMRQQSGDRPLVAYVCGEDRYDHFTVAGPPRGRLAEEDFELCRRDSEIKLIPAAWIIDFFGFRVRSGMCFCGSDDKGAGGDGLEDPASRRL